MTPYIGAGAGAAYMRVSDYASTVARGLHQRHAQSVEFRLGRHGRASPFPVAHNLMFDVGYRYMNFGDVSTECRRLR